MVYMGAPNKKSLKEPYLVSHGRLAYGQEELRCCIHIVIFTPSMKICGNKDVDGKIN
jgi:hypothetical protein